MPRDVAAHADLERTTVFGKWLTEKRGEMKQAKLAILVEEECGQGTNPGRISQWESGTRIPSPAQLGALHKLLDPNGPPPPTPEKAREEKR